MLDGSNVVVLDLETLRTADACRHCGHDLLLHYADGACEPWTGDRPSDDIHQFSALGWNNKPALGLSIGCFYSYEDGHYHWFDVHTLEATVRLLVERAPLLVSFNGIGFDFVLMRGLLRRQGESGADREAAEESDFIRRLALHALCDTFKTQCATSYDLLAEIWRVDPKRTFEKGLNSLGALSVANGLGAKEMDGVTAPRLWAQGRYAEVIAYNVSDVLKTKALFELVCAGKPILRGDGLPITLPLPSLEGYRG